MTTKPVLSRTQVIATLTLVSLVGAAGAWVFGRKVPPKNETFQAIAVDASITSDPKSRCDDVVGLADEAARLCKGVLHLTLFATGGHISGFGVDASTYTREEGDERSSDPVADQRDQAPEVHVKACDPYEP